jgi:hypothetical protein
MQSVHQPYFGWPGSWQFEENNHTDAELIALFDDEELLRTMIRRAFQEVWDATDGHVLYLSAGDPLVFKDWIRIWAQRVIRERLGLAPLEVQGYDNILKLPKSAKGITAKQIGDLGYARLAKIAYEEFLAFRDKVNAPHLKLRIGIAAPFDLAMLVDGFAFHIDGFIDAVANEINAILEFVDVDNVLFGWESPFGQILTAAFGPLGGLFARHSARQLQEVLDRVNKHIHLALHGCWGDFNGDSLIEGLLAHFVKKYLADRPFWRRRAANTARRMQSTRAAAKFANALQVAADSQMDEVQLPLAAGGAIPSEEPRHYRGLRTLKRLEGVHYIAGLCHKQLDDASARRVRNAASVGGNIIFDGFGPTCGLARTPKEKALLIIGQALHLCGYRRK